MKKRYFAPLICLAMLGIIAFLTSPAAKPKLISSIVSMDTAYLTVLASKEDVKDEKEFKEKLIMMCVEDRFDGIKLQTEKRGLPQRFHISVYVTKRDLECGSPYMTVKFETVQTP